MIDSQSTASCDNSLHSFISELLKYSTVHCVPIYNTVPLVGYITHCTVRVNDFVMFCRVQYKLLNV